MRHLTTLLCLAAFGSSMAQSATPHPVRIAIRHADPWFVMKTLQGQSLQNPEISLRALLTGKSLGQNMGPSPMNQLVKDGYFFVNAGDNSLWWVPSK